MPMKWIFVFLHLPCQVHPEQLNHHFIQKQLWLIDEGLEGQSGVISETSEDMDAL